MSVVDRESWERFLTAHPEAHVLQTAAWGDLKADFGWSVARVVAAGCGAQILFRRLPLGFSFAYLPKGPLGDDWKNFWPEVDRVCRAKRAVLLKVEPDAWMDEESACLAKLPGFQVGMTSVQPRRTILVDLVGSEDSWLERMKPKTRYNIRLAQRKEVVVEPSDDLDGFYNLMTITGRRDGFGVHSLEYYRQAYMRFRPFEAAQIFLARYQGRPLAALMVFVHGRRAWYFYGASNDEERNRMPTYLLQWEAMRWAAQRGCVMYDLWGVPDEEEETLEANFEARHDGLWGVYRFKRGFGGQLMRALPAYEKPYIQSLYVIYRYFMARKAVG